MTSQTTYQPEAEARPTTVHSRYEVSDPLCGWVDAEMTHHRAIETAAYHEARHIRESDPTMVTVYDVMARRGAPHLWDTSGKVLAYRHDA